MRVLGAHVASGVMYLACAEDGEIVELDHYDLTLTQGLEHGRALQAAVEDGKRLISRAGADQVVVLEPEPSGRATYGGLVDRIAVESCVAIATSQLGVTFHRLNRARLRSLLGLPRAGMLASYAAQVTVKVSPHWTNARDLASMTAIAVSRPT